MAGGQSWAVSADGGYLSNNKLSKQIRKQAQPLMKFAQFTRPEPGFGKQNGDTLKFDRISNVATQGGVIGESQQIPETKVNISQGTLTLAEYGNSIPYTGKLEALAEFDVNNITQKALLDDQAKAIDTAIYTTMATAKIKYTPTGSLASPSKVWATTGTVVTAATREISTYDVKQIVDAMKKTYLIPYVTGSKEKYVCIADVNFLRGIKDDPDFISAVQYGRPEDLYTGEIGMYEGVRFIEQVNNMHKLTSSLGGEAFFFGDDAIIEGVAIAPEIRAKIPGDYGRSKGVAWYGIMGYALTFDTATAGEAKVIHVCSTSMV